MRSPGAGPALSRQLPPPGPSSTAVQGSDYAELSRQVKAGRAAGPAAAATTSGRSRSPPCCWPPGGPPSSWWATRGGSWRWPCSWRSCSPRSASWATTPGTGRSSGSRRANYVARRPARQPRHRAELRLVGRQAQPPPRPPQHEGADPDIAIGALAFTASQARAGRGAWPGWRSATRRTCSSRCCSLRSGQPARGEHPRAGQPGLAPPAPGRRRCSPSTWPATSPSCSWCSPRSRPSCSSWSSRACSACTWDAPSPPTTRACPSWTPADRTDFLRRQVLTSRNVRGGWLDRPRPGRPELPDRAPPVPVHAPAQPAPLPAPGQGVLPAAGPALLRDQPGRLLRPGAAPPQPRRQVGPPGNLTCIAGLRATHRAGNPVPPGPARRPVLANVPPARSPARSTPAPATGPAPVAGA